VFFDIDDTLVDHSTALRAAVIALHRSLGPGIKLQEFQAKWQAAHALHYSRFLKGEISYTESARARVRDVISDGLSDEAADALFAKYLTDYESGWTLFPDVLPCLAQLRAVSLGVISNGPAVEQKRKLSRLRIANYFQWVSVSEEIGIAKPDARIFQVACERAGVAPQEALYVGDQYELDACAALSAGLKSVWLNRRAAGRPGGDGQSIKSLEALAALVALGR